MKMEAVALSSDVSALSLVLQEREREPDSQVWCGSLEGTPNSVAFYESTNTRLCNCQAPPSGDLIFILVPRRDQPVEKVVVCPVGGPKEARNKAKTLRNRRFQTLNRGRQEREGAFQHAGEFSEVSEADWARVLISGASAVRLPLY